MAAPLLSIVIVNYKTTNLLLDGLRSITHNDCSHDLEVIVIDNEVTVSTKTAILGQYPSAIVIENQTNVGYTRAVNQGIRLAHGEFILVLNADVELRKGALDRLVQFMLDHQGVGIAGAKLVYPDGQLQYSARTFYDLKTLLYRRTPLGRLHPSSPVLRRHLMLDWDHNTARQVDWVLGACLLVRREAMKQVGLMDERYFLYLEDVDWCYRMHQHGWEVYYVPEAEIVHHYRQGSRAERQLNKDALIHLLSMIRYLDKWNELWYLTKKHLHGLRLIGRVALDWVILIISFLLAYLGRSALAGPELMMTPPSAYYGIVAIYCLVHGLVFYLSGSYHPVARVSWLEEIPRLVKGTGITIGVVILFALVSHSYQSGYLYSRLTALLFWVFAILGLTLGRYLLFSLTRALWKRRLLVRRLLLVGYNEKTQAFQRELLSAPEAGYEIAGFVCSTESVGCSKIGDQILGCLPEIPCLVARERIHELVFFDVESYVGEGLPLALECRRNNIDIRIIAEDLGPLLLDPRIDYFFGFPSILFARKPFLGLTLKIKRGLDLIGAGVGLIAGAPLFLGCYLLGNYHSLKDLLCITEVIGRDRKPFLRYDLNLSKLPEVDQTPGRRKSTAVSLSRLLRNYYLEKLPQLVNVVRGDMSLIGPQPTPGDRTAVSDPRQSSRFSVQPGLTGLWQINKNRNWKYSEMIDLDLFYVHNWSLRMDCQILLRTLPVIMRGR